MTDMGECTQKERAGTAEIEFGRCHGCAEQPGEGDGLCATCRATTSLTYALDDAMLTGNTRRLINQARDDLMAMGGVPTV